MIGKTLGGGESRWCSMNTVTENCRDCIYYGKNLDNCDYFEIMNALRPCPPGDECTVKVTKDGKRREPKPIHHTRKKWDTQLAFQMWIEGVSGKQIAEAVGCADVTIYNYAKKNGWPERGRSRREKTNVKEETAAGAGSTGEEENQAAHEGTAGGTEAARSECDHLGSNPGYAEQPDPPAPDSEGNEGGGKMRDQKKPGPYEVAEACTDELSGIWAVCTADAVMRLQNWKDKEDLLRAKNAIEYMIRRMEAQDGKM